jgi:disease resistance protein RPS2
MGKKVKYLRIFHEVLFAKVTQKPNMRTMQDEMADSLNIKFDKNSEAGRARRIFSTIKGMNRKILVIFDDVQAKFDPEDVGIPCNCNSNRCKILLTTCCRHKIVT